MRRAMGKKDAKLMADMKKEFVEGAVRLEVPKKAAEDIFDLIEKFAKYGFNKSHSVAYSVIAYQTAYLKAHYPAEYMAATLTSEIGDTDKIVPLIDDCRRAGISVLPPDINESGKDFAVVGGAIRFGLVAIKGVGGSAIESVVVAREKEGPFQEHRTANPAPAQIATACPVRTASRVRCCRTVAHGPRPSNRTRPPAPAPPGTSCSPAGG